MSGQYKGGKVFCPFYYNCTNYIECDRALYNDHWNKAKALKQEIKYYETPPICHKRPVIGGLND